MSLHDLCRFDLQSLAMVQISADFWKRTNFINEFINGYRSSNFETSESKLIVNALDYFMELPHIPHIFKNELKPTVGFMGLRITEWLRIIEIVMENKGNNVQNLSFVWENIHWRNNGIIDTHKIITSLINHGILQMNYELWLYLAISCTQQRMPNWWVQFHCDPGLGQYVNGFSQMQYNLGLLLEIWCYYSSGILAETHSSILPELQTLWEDISTENNLFWALSFAGKSTAVEYYWNKLDADEKRKSLDKFVQYNRRHLTTITAAPAFDDTINTGDVLVFIMKHLSEEQLYNYLKKTNYDYDVIYALTAWPWVNLITPMVKLMVENAAPKLVAVFMRVLSRRINKCKQYDLDKVYRNLFLFTWKLIPVEVKEFIQSSV